MHNNPILIADIGGTNARFAFAQDSALQYTGAQTLQAAEFNCVTDAIDAYLASHNVTQLSAINLAVAGPIRNGRVSFPNSHWDISCDELQRHYSVTNPKLLNDWEAIAYSLTNFAETDLTPLGGNWSSIDDGDAILGAIGPGSGLGTVGLARKNNMSMPLVSEGGHAGFAPENALQSEILNYLQQKFVDRVSRERLLSGPGIVNLYEALCVIHGHENTGLSAVDIATAGTTGTNALCQETIDLFFEILGQVAGDIALTIGANQGMLVGGGICQRYPEQLANSKFRSGFENKGRHSHLMKSIPTWLITHENPGLLGTSVYAKQQTTSMV